MERMLRSIIVLCFLFMFSLTAGAGANPEAKDSSSGSARIEGGGSKPCNPPPITVPQPPQIIPGYTELDPATGLHVTGTMPEIKFEDYRLEVTGKVTHPLKLSYDDLRCMPKTEARPELVCPGYFKDTATWAGTPIKYILESAGMQEGAREINLVSADGYESSVSVKEAVSGPGFLAYEWEGKPLPLLHGFPVRAVFPGLTGSHWVKWLVRIEVE